MTDSVKKTSKKTKEVKAPVLHAHKLALPQDPQGFTGNLRRELARSVGRIGGDNVRLESFIETLNVFQDFARNKAQAQKEELQKKIADKQARLKTAQEAQLRASEGVIEGKRNVVRQYQAEIKAHEKRVGEK